MRSRLSYPFSAAALLLTAAVGAGAPYRISVTTRPSPPSIGGLTPIEVRVADASGAPVSGADVRVTAHMPAMPMGEVAKRADADPGRPGTYTLPWSFSMAGDWAIRVQVSGPAGVATTEAPLAIGGVSVPPWLRVAGWAALALALAALARFIRRPEGRHEARAFFVSTGNRIALATVLGVVAAVALIVHHFKQGQIDWNAMSMDMADFRSPAAVEVAKVRRGSIAAWVTYTGTVVPFLEQSVYPRAEGYLEEFSVYPGTRVRQGQALGRVVAPELSAKTREAEAGQVVAGHDVAIAEQERDRQAAETRVAADEVRAARSAVPEGAASVGAARDAAAGATAALAASQDSVGQAEQEEVAAAAAARRWAAEIDRERRLLDAGAVSREEYESERAENDSARAAAAGARSKIGEMRARQRMARAALDRANADVGVARAKLQELRDAVVTARARAESARAGVGIAEHTIEHRRAMVLQAAASTRTARIMEGFTAIRATTSGVVTERLVSPGVLVNPQTAIAKIARLDRVRLQANVAERDLSAIHRGTPVVVRAPFLGREVRTRVTDLFPAANAEARTAVVEALVDNAAGRFAPGQFITMEFLTEQRNGVLTAPVEAVGLDAPATGGSGSIAWTVVRDGDETKAHRNLVRTGVSDGRNQEIRSGLREGDVVITRGQDLLTDGSPVTLPGEPPAMTVQAPPAAVDAAGGMTRTAGPFRVTLSTDPSPPHVGDETLRLTVADLRGKPVSGVKVHLDTSMPTMGMGGPSADAREEGGGRYSASASMMMGGPWRVRARVSAPGSPPATATFDFAVQ